MNKENYLNKLNEMSDKIKNMEQSYPSTIVITGKDSNELINKINEKRVNGYSLGVNKIEQDNGIFYCMIDKIITPSQFELEFKEEYLKMLEGLLFDLSNELAPAMRVLIQTKLGNYTPEQMTAAVKELEGMAGTLGDMVEIFTKMIMFGLIHDLKTQDLKRDSVILEAFTKAFTKNKYLKDILISALPLLVLKSNGAITPEMVEKIIAILNNKPGYGCGFAGTYNDMHPYKGKASCKNPIEDSIPNFEYHYRRDNSNDKYNKPTDINDLIRNMFEDKNANKTNEDKTKDIAKTFGDVVGKIINKSTTTGEELKKMAKDFAEQFEKSVKAQIDDNNAKSQCKCKKEKGSSDCEENNNKDLKDLEEVKEAGKNYQLEKLDIVINGKKKNAKGEENNDKTPDKNN